VILHQSAGIAVGPNAVVEPGAELTGPCRILGASRIARGARVGAFCQLTDALIEAGAEVREFSHLEAARLETGAIAGPFARLRPGALLEENARVGNFVEMKKSVLGPGAKASHLAYLGDANVGAGANIGAGTITCNYDGVAKHRTVIEDDCFIGSDATLVAPVRISRGSYVDAGSTITRDTPPGQLTVGRARQVSIPGWKPPKKKG
jgi:bifunctional UDP-N-acetylglucosamine pyrophosphorylase/glucosamine-1-phosphate N-acetyltransferase